MIVAGQEILCQANSSTHLVSPCSNCSFLRNNTQHIKVSLFLQQFHTTLVEMCLFCHRSVVPMRRLFVVTSFYALTDKNYLNFPALNIIRNLVVEALVILLTLVIVISCKMASVVIFHTGLFFCSEFAVKYLHL